DPRHPRDGGIDPCPSSGDRVDERSKPGRREETSGHGLRSAVASTDRSGAVRARGCQSSQTKTGRLSLRFDLTKPVYFGGLDLSVTFGGRAFSGSSGQAWRG